MKNLLSLVALLFGLQSTAVQGMDYVVKDIAPAGLFVVGSIGVPAAAAYFLTNDEINFINGCETVVNNRTPAVLHGATVGLISASAMLCAYYLCNSRSSKEKNIVSFLSGLVVWSTYYLLYKKELDKGESKAWDTCANIGGNYLLQTVGAASFVAGYYLVTGKR